MVTLFPEACLPPMTLNRLPLPASFPALPGRVRMLIDEAEERIELFQEEVGEQASPAFEPAEYAEVAAVLCWLRRDVLPAGGRFCEWGCGFGVVAGIADLLGFESTGLERDPLLLDQARVLKDDFGLRTELVAADFFEPGPGSGRPVTTDIDLVYAYPWPRETGRLRRHFAAAARPGAHLLIFHASTELSLYRKASKARPSLTEAGRRPTT